MGIKIIVLKEKGFLKEGACLFLRHRREKPFWEFAHRKAHAWLDLLFGHMEMILAFHADDVPGFGDWASRIPEGSIDVED